MRLGVVIVSAMGLATAAAIAAFIPGSEVVPGAAEAVAGVTPASVSSGPPARGPGAMRPASRPRRFDASRPERAERREEMARRAAARDDASAQQGQGMGSLEARAVAPRGHARNRGESPEADAPEPDSEALERSEDLDAYERAFAQLHSADPALQMDGIDQLLDLDPVQAQAAIESLLRGAEKNDDVRFHAFDRLVDLLDASNDRIGALIRGLSDPSALVRDYAAYYLSSEDVESDPKVVSALRRALGAETDPAAVSSIENALEMHDPAYVPPGYGDPDANGGDPSA